MTEVPEDQVRDLENSADDMEEGLGRLQGDIDTAHEKLAEQRERADPEAVAGDFEGESTGAQQGDDAQDAEGRAGDGDGAPVYEASEVTPGADESGSQDTDDDGSDEDDSDDDDSGGGATVHEAEQVEPEGSADGDDAGEGSAEDDDTGEDDPDDDGEDDPDDAGEERSGGGDGDDGFVA